MEETRLLHLSPSSGLELRADTNGGPGIISGPVVVYGDTANMGRYMERMEAGVFGDSINNPKLVATYFHQRDRPLARLGFGLTLTDSPTELRAELALPDTSDGRDIGVLMRDGALLGFSGEFHPRQTRQENRGQLLVRRTAIFGGLSIVDTPAYPLSKAEIRQDEPMLRRRNLWL